MCHTITSSLSLGAIVENMLRIPMGYFLIGRGIVLLRDPKEPEFRVEGLRGISRDIFHKTLRLHDPPGHSVLMADHAGDEEWAAFFRGFGIEIVLPLATSRGVLGLLGFGERIGGKAFGLREIEFLDSLSGIAATAVAIAGSAGGGLALTGAGLTTFNLSSPPYSAAKAGVIGLTKSAAKELASRNITVNAIAPGLIQTDMTAAFTEKAMADMVSRIPLGRAGTPEDVAGVALFLASKQADYITGQVIHVNGGMWSS